MQRDAARWLLRKASGLRAAAQTQYAPAAGAGIAISNALSARAFASEGKTEEESTDGEKIMVKCSPFRPHKVTPCTRPRCLDRTPSRPHRMHCLDVGRIAVCYWQRMTVIAVLTAHKLLTCVAARSAQPGSRDVEGGAVGVCKDNDAHAAHGARRRHALQVEARARLPAPCGYAPGYRFSSIFRCDEL